MNTKDTIVCAIKEMKPIKFKYVKENKTREERIGNPHAIFKINTKENGEHILAHIVQTEGDSDSIYEKPLPSFRTFEVKYMCEIEILEEKEAFEIDENYNPYWSGYDNTISKV